MTEEPRNPSMLSGDEWKTNRAPTPPVEDRAMQQHRVNEDYLLGLVTLEEWRSKTDLLSEPTIQPT